MKPYMIVRTNLDSPDFVIHDDDPLQISLNKILRLATDQSSNHFIDNEYILYRLLDCAKIALKSPANHNTCPIIFDSWSCWNSTELNSTQVTQCPQFVNLGFLAERTATKQCTEDGTWWVHPVTNRFIQFSSYLGLNKSLFSVGPGLTTPAALTMLMSTSTQQ